MATALSPHRSGNKSYPLLLQYPVIMENKSPELYKLEKFQEALGVLNELLTDSSYVTGNTVTIADHVLLATVATAVAAGQPLYK